jgi:hypothetical protein
MFSEKPYDTLLTKPATWIYLGIFLVLVIFGIKYGELVDHYDGLMYYAYLPSIIIDHDLDFSNQYAALQCFSWYDKTPTGHLGNIMAIGPAILWSPVFILMHLAAWVCNLLGYHLPMDGNSLPYTLSPLLGNIIYFLFSLNFIYRLCRKYFPVSITIVAISSIILSSFYIFYLIFAPSYSHITSLAMVSWFIYYWDKTRKERTTSSWVILGILSGLMTLVRWQNCIFAVVLVWDLVNAIILNYQNKNFIRIKELLMQVSLYAVIVFIMLIPQMLIWKIIYGKYITIPLGSGYMLWKYPMISETLFSSRHGLFSWTPLAMFGLLGSLFFYKRDKLLAGYLLIIFSIMLYINSCVSDWWGGGGFGMRRFDGFLILFTLGLATLISGIRVWIQKYPVGVIGLMLLGLIGWNGVLIRQYNNRQISPGDVVSWNKVSKNQINYMLTKFGYPFSYPANILFSRKYHVSPDKYDIVSGKYLDYLDHQLNGVIDLYSIDPEFLGSGWAYTEMYYDTPVRWANKPESSLFVTLRYPADYMVTIHALPFSYPNAPMQTITVIANRKEVGIISLENQWKEYMIYIPKKYWNPGINELKFRYAYAISPAQVLPGNPDTRTLAVCWHYLKFSKLK